MELKKHCCKLPRDTFIDLVDYNSTKANFDELEKLIREAEKDVNRSAWMVDEVCDDIFKRLTALEAKVDNLPTMKIVNGGLTVSPAFFRDIKMQSPNTCGNCKRAWVDESHICVICGVDNQLHAPSKDACPEHELRKV